MKILKAVAIILCTFAVLLTCAAVFVSVVNPNIFNKNDIPLETAPSNSPEISHTANSASKQNQKEPEISQSPSLSPSPSQTKPSPPSTVQSSSNSNAKKDARTLIIGRWKASTDKNSHIFEFFQDGTFSIGSYTSEHDYINFTGTYSFSSNSRLKLQYEESTIEVQ